MEKKRKKISNKSSISKNEKPLLEIENLNMSFKKRGLFFDALKNVSFSVNEGDFFGIIGESGSGKSTTGKCIIKLYQPTGGKIEIDNHLVSNKKISRKTNKWLRKNVQMIFQDPMASLNPTKNILQLISEPLIINKSLYKNACSHWKKLNDVAKYYLMEFTRRNNNLVYDFKHDYLSSIKEKLSTSIENWDLDFDDNDNHKLTREKLIFKMDTLVDYAQENSPLVNNFISNTQQLINELTTKYNNEDYEEIFKIYEHKLIELSSAKNIYKYSKEGYQLKKTLEQKKKEYKDFISVYKEKYVIQNYGYIKSWETTIKSNIKNIKQSINFSKDTISYTINFVNLTIQKFLLIFVKELKNNKYLEEEEINSTIDYSNTIVERMFDPINKKILELSNEFNNANIDQKNIIIENLFALRLIAKLLYENFKTNTWNNYDNVKEQFSTILSKFPNFSQLTKKTENEIMTFSDFDKDFNNLCLIYDDLKSFISILQEKSNAKHSKFIHEKREKKSNISRIEIDLKINLSIYKETKDLLEKNKNYYLSIKNDFEKFSKEREEYLENVVFTSIAKESENLTKKAMILSQLKVELKSLKLELKLKTKNSYYLIRKQFKNESSDKNIWEKIKNYKEQKSFLSSLKKEINMRKKSIDALNFEFKNSLKESKINSLIFEQPRYINWLLIPSLINLMKKDLVYKALDDVGLKREHAYRYPHEFSGGQRQRIVIARALINNPKIIIADEPISALDVSIQAQIINILQDLCKKQNVTILFIAHDLSMVNYACNNVIIMHRGRILEKGNVNKIFENPIHPYTKSLMKATPKLSRVHVDLAAFNEDFVYDKDWTIFNKPNFHKVNDDVDHQVFGTQDQVQGWISASLKEKNNNEQQKKQ